MSDTTEDNPINYAMEILIEQGFGGGDCDMLKLHLEKYPMLVLRDRYRGEKYKPEFVGQPMCGVRWLTSPSFC